jgi:manganese transport protein
MAAAITWQSVSGQSMNMKAKGYRMVWVLVMATGFVFGVSGLKPIPVILIAQAINGLLLPVSAIFLIIIINDRSVPTAFRNSGLQNFGLITVVAVAVALGVNNLSKFVSGLLNMIS